MRLGLVVYGSLDQLSGGYLYDRQVAQALGRRGHAVHPIGLPDRGYFRNLLSGLAGDVRLRSDLEVLLQDELCHPSLIAANRRMRRNGYAGRIIALLHHPLSAEPRAAWANRLFRSIERAYFRSVDAILCTSRATREAVRQLAPAGVTSWAALPGRDHLGGGLDEQAIARRALEQGPLQILFLGNLIPRKGLDTLLRALAGLPPERWKLTVAGSAEMAPGYAARLRSLAQQLGLDGRVRWLGPLSHAELESLLPRMHLLAVPSRHEGFGIAYLEGMAYGLPCLASASGGARDLVRDGQNGYLIPPGDERALAWRVRQLAEDRQRLAEMGRAARRAWEAHPTWGETAASIEAYLTNGPADPTEAEGVGRGLHPEEGAP
jgi:glycosyltransferase involved in cell wall biosynthesis